LLFVDIFYAGTKKKKELLQHYEIIILEQSLLLSTAMVEKFSGTKYIHAGYDN
jgi:hypothetical protein